MSVIELKLLDGAEDPYILFFVDGHDFGTQVKAAFGEAGYDSCLPWYGVDYQLDETVVGQEIRRSGGKSVVFLVCGCGCWACSGVHVDVDVTDGSITWSGFSTWWKGERIVAPVDPVTFDRAQFDDAVAKLHAELDRLYGAQTAVPPAGGGDCD